MSSYSTKISCPDCWGLKFTAKTRLNPLGQTFVEIYCDTSYCKRKLPVYEREVVNNA